MSAPHKIHSNVKWVTDKFGNVIGYQNDLGITIPSLESGYVLLQSAIPFIMTSSGSFGSFGVLSGITGINTAHAAAYCYFPANSISVSGNAAGWYFTVFRSTTVADVYQNTYLVGQPQIPEVLVPWTTGGPGAFTQATSIDIPGPTAVVNADALGRNGGLLWERATTVYNSAGAKKINTYLGGLVIQGATFTTTAYNGAWGSIKNRGSANSQYSINGGNGDIGNAGGVKYLSIDTTQNQLFSQSLNLAVATDYAVLESYSFKIFPRQT